jgi:hypothetical protein
MIEHKISEALGISFEGVFDEGDYRNDEAVEKHFLSVYKAYGDENPMRRPEVKAIHMSAVRSEEYRQKMSELKTGLKHREESIEKMKRTHKERGTGKWNLGVPKSEDTKQKMSEAHLKKERVPCSKCGKGYTKANIKKHEAACKGKD